MLKITNKLKSVDARLLRVIIAGLIFSVLFLASGPDASSYTMALQILLAATLGFLITKKIKTSE